MKTLIIPIYQLSKIGNDDDSSNSYFVFSMKLTLEEKAMLKAMNDKFSCSNKNGLLKSLMGNQAHLYNIIRF